MCLPGRGGRVTEPLSHEGRTLTLVPTYPSFCVLVGETTVPPRPLTPSLRVGVRECRLTPML